MSNEKPFFKSARGIIVLMILLIAFAFLSLRMGSASLNGLAFWGGLLRRNGFSTESTIIFSIRLPRMIAAVLAGSGLSVSGVLLQSVTGNDLAGPNIIGVNAGAGFSIILLMFFFPSAVYLFPLVSFCGAFFTTLLIVSISAGINRSKSTVVLAGVAVTAILNAGISFLSLLNPDVLVSYSYFSVGGLSGVMTNELVGPALMIFPCILLSIFLSRRIDTLCLGDSIAASLGVNVGRLRILSLMIASACAAAVVSFAGLLGFVGLIVPHMARKLVGQGMLFLVPVSALLGAILVLAADLLGRTLFSPTELPVGIVMALIGAPFFFWLLIRQKRGELC